MFLLSSTEKINALFYDQSEKNRYKLFVIKKTKHVENAVDSKVICP